jgi:PAS domain S-box-containing protein
MGVLALRGRVATPPPRAARPKWHRLYFLLAAFDVLTVVLSLTLSHEIRGILAQSVAVNQAWGQRLADYSDLGELAQAVDAPGNDVFDTLDVQGESAKEQTALRVFNERLAALQAEVQANARAVDEGILADFEQDFGDLTDAMSEMTAESDLIFSYFARNQPEEAGRRMATMDRKYATVHRALNELRRDVAAIQRQNFDQQEATAESLSKFEYVIAAFILLMVSAATKYGHKMATRVEADARDRERWLDVVSDAEARTRSIVDTAADSIVTFDERGLIESTNASTGHMFGYEEADLIGRDISLLLPRVAQADQDPTGVDWRTGGLQGEEVGRRQDGTTFPLELVVSELRLGGRRMFTAIIRDITERKRAEAERNSLYQTLAEREHALENLIRKLFLAQEEERRRVAYEVHDGLAQLTAAAQQHLEAFASRVHPRSPEARKELAQARELAQQTVREARRVIAGLRPTALDDFGLAAAIRLELDALRREGWDISYAEELGSHRLPSEIETALFRVAQEALRNVRKHADTQRVELCLGYRGQGVRLEVRDWGRGFQRVGPVGRDGPGERVGIPGMQERVALLGGKCAVHSRRGAGTHVVVEVPVSLGAPGK